MRKFLTLLTALCLTLVASISLVGCGGGNNPETPGPQEPAYVSITENDWYKVLENSNARNVTVQEKITDGPNVGKQPIFKIADTKVAYDVDGMEKGYITDSEDINTVIHMFDFYNAFSFSNFTFDADNNTYAYSKSYTVDIIHINEYSDSSMLTYTYSNIVVKLVERSDKLFISEITCNRVITYESGFVQITPDTLTLTYSNFGSTVAIY